MAPFEALYGRKCRTPLNWVEAGERRYYGIDFLNEAEQKVRTIQQHLEAAQARQKSYADKRRKPIEFSQLKKCLRVPEERVEVRDIKLKSDLVYEEKPIAVVDHKERETRNRVVKLYKV